MVCRFHPQTLPAQWPAPRRPFFDCSTMTGEWDPLRRQGFKQKSRRKTVSVSLSAERWQKRGRELPISGRTTHQWKSVKEDELERGEGGGGGGGFWENKVKSKAKHKENWDDAAEWLTTNEQELSYNKKNERKKIWWYLLLKTTVVPWQSTTWWRPVRE